MDNQTNTSVTVRNARNEFEKNYQRRPLGVMLVQEDSCFLLWDEDRNVYMRLMEVKEITNPHYLTLEETILFEEKMIDNQINHCKAIFKPKNNSGFHLEVKNPVDYNRDNQYPKYAANINSITSSKNSVVPKIINYCIDRDIMLVFLNKEVKDKNFDNSTIFIQKIANGTYIIYAKDAKVYSNLTLKSDKEIYHFNKIEYENLIALLKSNFINYAVFEIEKLKNYYNPKKILAQKSFSSNRYEFYQNSSHIKTKNNQENLNVYNRGMEEINNQIKAIKGHRKQLSKDTASDKPTWEDMRRERYKDKFR